MQKRINIMAALFLNHLIIVIILLTWRWWDWL